MVAARCRPPPSPRLPAPPCSSLPAPFPPFPSPSARFVVALCRRPIRSLLAISAPLHLHACRMAGLLADAGRQPDQQLFLYFPPTHHAPQHSQSANKQRSQPTNQTKLICYSLHAIGAIAWLEMDFQQTKQIITNIQKQRKQPRRLTSRLASSYKLRPQGGLQSFKYRCIACGKRGTRREEKKKL